MQCQVALRTEVACALNPTRTNPARAQLDNVVLFLIITNITIIIIIIIINIAIIAIIINCTMLLILLHQPAQACPTTQLRLFPIHRHHCDHHHQHHHHHN